MIYKEDLLKIGFEVNIEVQKNGESLSICSYHFEDRFYIEMTVFITPGEEKNKTYLAVGEGRKELKISSLEQLKKIIGLFEVVK
jgi:hypothetical protein